MEYLKRLWQISAFLYFCAFELIASKITTPVARAAGFVFFFPYRDLIKLSPPERLRVAFERLGTVYIKIGQLLSTRVDILPPEFIKELGKLQDRVPPQPIEELLSSYPFVKKYFEEIDPFPIGSGSVAQVHKGRLKSGKEVAVKFIRPGVEGEIKKDLKVLKVAVGILSSFVPFFREFRIPRIVEEIERMLLSELDLTTEAAYAELFRKFSEKEKNLYIPAVLWDISGPKVLVTEFVSGKKLTEEIPLSPEERKTLAERFVNIVHRMVFELGVFHGDLHPGNIFLLPDGRFAFVDFGIVGRLSPGTLSQFFFFSVGVMNRDPDLIVGALKRIGALPEGINENLLKREIMTFLDRYYNRPLSRIDAEKLFYEELSTARKFKIVPPEELVILMKTIAHTESIARLIYPDFRLPPLLKPYLKKLAPKVATKELRRKVLNLLTAYGELIEE
ncbi:MAG: AarF/UbiB family protein, partial [Desulfurobacteriaceae bacterium]